MILERVSATEMCQAIWTTSFLAKGISTNWISPGWSNLPAFPDRSTLGLLSSAALHRCSGIRFARLQANHGSDRQNIHARILSITQRIVMEAGDDSGCRPVGPFRVQPESAIKQISIVRILRIYYSGLVCSRLARIALPPQDDRSDTTIISL